MSNNKQSSVEWLVEQLSWYSEEMIFLYKNEIEQAKAMHKQEIIDAQSYAVSHADMTNNKGYFDCEQYYNETYNK